MQRAFSRMSLLAAVILLTASTMWAVTGSSNSGTSVNTRVDLKGATDAITIPQLVNYQGKLTDGSGNPVTTPQSMTFRFWDDPSAGNLKWQEVQPTVAPDANGVFNVLLGSVTPIESIPQGGNCWLEIAVGATPILPRTHIVSTPYAYGAELASDADKVDGQHASGFASAAHTHTASGDVTGDVTGPLTIAADAVNSAKVADGTIINADISGTAAIAQSKVSNSLRAIDADLLDGYHASGLPVPSHNHWGQTWSGSGVGLELSSGTVDWELRGYCTGTGAGLVAVGNGPVFGGRGALEAINVNNTGVGVVAQGQNCGSYHYAISGAGMQANGLTYGLWATAENGSGTTYGVNGRTYSSGGWGVYGISNNGYWGGLGGAYGVYYSGGLAGTGTKSCVVKTTQGPRLLYCQESPENWFEDFGEGQLHDGRAHVGLERLFLETVSIDAGNPMKVFLQQTTGDEPVSLVVQRGVAGFDVVGPAGSNVGFSYRVVAKRRGYEDVRMKKEALGYADRQMYPDDNDPEIPAGIRALRREARSDNIKTNTDLVKSVSGQN